LGWPDLSIKRQISRIRPSQKAIRSKRSPLVEDNSVKSPAYTTVDLQAGFRASKWLAALDVFNVANMKWNDIECYYVSRLKNEVSPLADTVVHAGVPRTLRPRLQYQF
jgi:hypothetical protein